MQRVLIAVFVALLVTFVIADDRQAPPFLQGATPDQISDFFKMIDADKDKTDAQIDQDVQTFVENLGGNFSQQFTDFKTELKKGEEDYEKAHEEAISKLSQAAQDADKKMTEIANNQDLTAQQKSQQIQAVMDALPANVQDEIKNALNQ